MRIGVVTTGTGRIFSTIVLRGAISTEVLFQDANASPAVVASRVVQEVRKYDIKASNIFVEALGSGQEVYEIVRRQLDDNGYINQRVVAVKPGDEPELTHYDKNDYLNRRSQSYWRLKNWIERNPVELENNVFNQLAQIRYKIHADKKIGVKTRDEMMHDGLQSPDAIDALALTFSRKREIELRRPYVQPPWEAMSEYEGGGY